MPDAIVPVPAEPVVLVTANAPLARNPLELAAAKAAAGTETPMVTVPVIPAEGPTARPVGSMAAVMVKDWKGSPIQTLAARLMAVILGAALTGGIAIGYSVLKAGSIWKVHSHDLIDVGLLAAIPVLLAGAAVAVAYLAKVARAQNNPTN